jgi:hypothetical protein
MELNQDDSLVSQMGGEVCSNDKTSWREWGFVASKTKGSSISCFIFMYWSDLMFKFERSCVLARSLCQVRDLIWTISVHGEMYLLFNVAYIVYIREQKNSWTFYQELALKCFNVQVLIFFCHSSFSIHLNFIDFWSFPFHFISLSLFHFWIWKFFVVVLERSFWFFFSCCQRVEQ